MNTNSSLVNELRDPDYRSEYVASQISIGFPFQVRALRKARNWTQKDLAKAAGMAQPRIAEIESPGERKLNVETMLRLAAAFDVALLVRFAPFGDFVDWNESFDPNCYEVPTFSEEAEAAELHEQNLAAIAQSWEEFQNKVSQINVPTPKPSLRLVKDNETGTPWQRDLLKPTLNVVNKELRDYNLAQCRTLNVEQIPQAVGQ